MKLFLCTKENYMKNLFLVLSLFTVTSLFSQKGATVNGNIVDLEMGGEPLMFATVSLDGTSWNTQTNFNGNFELVNIAPGNYTMTINSLGYKTLEIPVAIEENSVVSVERGMQAKSISLQEALSSDVALSDLP